MKRFHLAFLIALASVLLVAPLAFAQADKHWIEAEGHVVYQDERDDVVRKNFVAYRDVFFMDYEKKVGHYICNFEKVQSQIPVTVIRSLKKDPFTKKVTVTDNRGETFVTFVDRDLSWALTNMRHLEVRYYNDITKRMESGFILGQEIQEIHFNDTSKVTF